jgi:hypothetical protein
MKNNPGEPKNEAMLMLSFLFAPSTPSSYVVHLPRGLDLLVIVVVEARHRGEVVVVFALGAGLVRRALSRVPLDVVCKGPLISN